MNNEIENCQNCKNPFTIEPDDFSFYEKMKVPPPTFCPECRSQRRLSWRNDTSLYNQKCVSCNKSVITIYSPGQKMQVYCNKCWWSDKWDPKDYGVEYDFSMPFFTQLAELTHSVPHMALINDDTIGSINCEYTNDFAFSKNCYMVFIAWKIEDSMYTFYAVGGREMVDCLAILDVSEYVYEGIDLLKCYRVKYSQLATECTDSAFLYDCKDCSNCFMCSGLRHKKYHFKNQEYNKEEYEVILNSYQLDTHLGVERAKTEFEEFYRISPRRFASILQSVDSTGDYLQNSKNSKFCFTVQRSENCKWIDNSDTPTDCYDLATGGELSECYEGITCDHSNKNLFGIYSWKNQDVQYTQHCHSSKHLFGCVGLRNAEYCIFNKQYKKDEYELLIGKIKKQMLEIPYVDAQGISYAYGEFYPSELSPFGYNETIAQERYPLSNEEANKKGWQWVDSMQRTVGQETLQPEQIPDSIQDVSDNILKEILRCFGCARNYRIVEAELGFYKRMGIPIPRKCFYCRHGERNAKRNPYKLWHRSCMCDKAGHDHDGKCPNEFETSYAPNRPEIVYCESCYQKEVI